MEVTISRKLYGNLQPIFVTTKILGINPMSVQAVGNKVLMSRSTLLVIYGLVLVIAAVISLIYGANAEMSNPFVAKIRLGSATATYTQFMEYSFVVICIASRVILAPFKMSNFIRLLRALDEIDNRLPVKDNSPANDRRLSIILIIVLSCFAWLTNIFNSYSWYLLGDGSIDFFLHCIHYMAKYFIEFYIVILQLFYCHMVYFIMRRIKRLNYHLEAPATSFDSPGLIHVKELIMSKTLLRNTDDDMSNVASTEDLSAKHISNLITVHRKICNAIYHLNDSFGFSLLIMMLGYIFYLVITPYHLYAKLKSATTYAVIVAESLWLVSHIVKLMMLVESCGRCTDEINNTMYIVRQHLATNLSEKIRSQYGTLSAQIRQCPIEFTIMGISTIDRGLLASVTGVVTTYLVILFQFKN